MPSGSKCFRLDEFPLLGLFDAGLSTILPIMSGPIIQQQRPIVFMDINIGETPAGRIKFELFSDIVPKYVFITLDSSQLTIGWAGPQKTSDSYVQGSTGALLLSYQVIYWWTDLAIAG